MKNSSISTIKFDFDEELLKFVDKNQCSKKKTIKEYKSFIIECKKRNITNELIAFKIGVSPSSINIFVRKLRFDGEI